MVLLQELADLWTTGAPTAPMSPVPRRFQDSTTWGWQVTGRNTPTWLDEPCPPWCVRTHLEDDHPEDRYHQSDPSFFTGVAGDGDQVPMTASLNPVTLGVRLGRHVGEAGAWVVIESLESRHPRLILTAEAAVALRQRLEHQLARL